MSFIFPIFNLKNRKAITEPWSFTHDVKTQDNELQELYTKCLITVLESYRIENAFSY